MRVALLGTRGIPARHGGFETAIAHIGPGLVQRGWDVTVYCRNAGQTLPEYDGCRLVNLPALRTKQAETMSHTALSAAHLVVKEKADVAIVFNSGNAPFLSILQAARIPTAVHVDGLEANRAKWQGIGAKYYRWAERRAVRSADAIIADAQGIADHISAQYGREAVLLTYGATLTDPPIQRIGELGLQDQQYHLCVARFEPENHVLEIVSGYRSSSAALPLIVVGAASYSHEYADAVEQAAQDDPRIRFVGSVWDEQLLDNLYLGARSVIHGHSVGGTNPSLLRAMGAAARVTAFDCVFNREVTGGHARWFREARSVAAAVMSDEAEADDRGQQLRARAEVAYRWDDVIDGYAALCTDLSRR